MCVDYRDLNRANPKDNFPLSHIDTLIDNTMTNMFFPFMDGFLDYNQVKMAEEDSQNSIHHSLGNLRLRCHAIRLRDARATYQRPMVTLFHDMMHKEIEVYVDDMIAKSRTPRDHLIDLRKLFKCLVKYRLRLNPNKCIFGAS